MFSFVTQKWKLVGLNLREKHRLHVIQVPKECLEQLQMSDICQKQIYTSQLEIAAEIDYIQAEWISFMKKKTFTTSNAMNIKPENLEIN